MPQELIIATVRTVTEQTKDGRIRWIHEYLNENGEVIRFEVFAVTRP